MIFFKNAKLYTTKLTETRNKIGQVIKKYVKDKEYIVNMQDITQTEINKEWGADIKSTKQIYTEKDLDLNIDDIVIVKDKTYKVEKKIEWDSYNIYALIQVDIAI